MPTNGSFLQFDCFDNTGGLNQSDSAFRVQDSQAVDGANFNYATTGGFEKRMGHAKVNTSADTQLKSIGLSQHSATDGTKTVIRMAGTKIQNVDTSVPSFTNLSEDVAVSNSDFLSSTSTQPVAYSQFNTSSADILWSVGAGMTGIYGVVKGSPYVVTKNGTATPTGAITPAVSATGGSFAATGTYRYAVAWRKTKTQALSNVALETSATISATTDKVTIDLTGITNQDTTHYDKLYIYRSAVGGASGFTTGDLIAQVDATVALTSYVDTGTYISTAENIPRAGNTILDNSTFPAGTPVCLTTFKRRLVSAIGSTLYFSDVNKPESWPSANFITIPSGGSITAVGIISFTTSGSNTIDEILAVFKERELWVVTGNTVAGTGADVVLKFIDPTGCPSQSILVQANGFLSWLDYRGVYLWDGTGKPIYCSRPIEPLFAAQGDLDKPKLGYCVGRFFRKQNAIFWYLSSKLYGEQKFQLKLDLRLTAPNVSESLTLRVMDGVFNFERTSFAIYAADSHLPTSPEERLLLGDGSGFLYSGYMQHSDAGDGISFTYKTKHLNMGNPSEEKRFHYVVAWVQEIGNWNLTLDWWTDYNSATNFKSTRALQIAEGEQNAVALWDVAYWDVAFWDDYAAKLKPIIFAIGSDAMNASEGKAIQLQFRNENANEPIYVHGFSVLYSNKGLRVR